MPKDPPPHLKLKKQMTLHSTSLYLTLRGVFPNFVDAEMHLLEGFITLKEKRYCITI